MSKTRDLATTVVTAFQTPDGSGMMSRKLAGKLSGEKTYRVLNFDKASELKSSGQDGINAFVHFVVDNISEPAKSLFFIVDNNLFYSGMAVNSIQPTVLDVIVPLLRKKFGDDTAFENVKIFVHGAGTSPLPQQTVEIKNKEGELIATINIDSFDAKNIVPGPGKKSKHAILKNFTDLKSFTDGLAKNRHARSQSDAVITDEAKLAFAGAALTALNLGSQSVPSTPVKGEGIFAATTEETKPAPAQTPLAAQSGVETPLSPAEEFPLFAKIAGVRSSPFELDFLSPSSSGSLSSTSSPSSVSSLGSPGANLGSPPSKFSLNVVGSPASSTAMNTYAKLLAQFNKATLKPTPELEPAHFATPPGVNLAYSDALTPSFRLGKPQFPLPKINEEKSDAEKTPTEVEQQPLSPNRKPPRASR